MIFYKTKKSKFEIFQVSKIKRLPILKLGKKGSTTAYTLLFAVRLMVLLPILILLSLYGSSFIVSSINAREIEIELVSERFMYSGQGFTYIDENTQRPYIGYVDTERFNDNNLTGMITGGFMPFSARFTLTYPDGKKEFAYYNEQIFRKYFEMSGFSSSISRYEKNFFVQVVNSSVKSNNIILNSKSAVLRMDLVVFDE